MVIIMVAVAVFMVRHAIAQAMAQIISESI
jgi:hypothetical protein